MCVNPITIIINKEQYKVPCGKCEICKLKKIREWSIKLINEAKYHKKVCFITCTFDNKILISKDKKINKYKADISFIYHIKNSKEYFKKFIKRLRKHYKNNYISYYHVGEYGEKTKRPHHHAIIYGINFEEDRKTGELSKSGHIQYISETLTKLWGAGRCTIQDANNNNIIYTAQYVNKKNNVEERYKPIFSFSNRCKISEKWAIRNHKELQKGYIETNDKKKFPIPKSYKKAIKKRAEEGKENFTKTLIEIEDKIYSYKIDLNDQKRKNELLKIRNNKKTRDF